MRDRHAAFSRGRKPLGQIRCDPPQNGSGVTYMQADVSVRDKQVDECTACERVLVRKSQRFQGYEMPLSMKGLSTLENRKIYLLAEVTVRPEFLDEVKAVLKEALVRTLQEPGCEALFVTSREDDRPRLVFFEVFSSPEAHKLHLEQDYTKRMLAAVEGKLAQAPIMTGLNTL
jgi:quinol monooxygenase YgiN